MEDKTVSTGSEKVSACLDDVFRLPLLQEKILNYAIHTKDGSKLSRANTLSYCAVNHTWMGAVVQHLERIGEPVLKFNCEGLPCAGRPAPSNARFKKFLEVYVDSPRELNWIPPFELTLDLYQGHLEKTIPYLSQCLQFCGAALLKLTLRFNSPLKGSESDGALLQQVFETVSLPVLKTFEVTFSDRPRSRGRRRDLRIGTNIEITPLVQAVLHGCEQLRHFSLRGCPLTGDLPRDLKNMVLPSTLATIKITKGPPGSTPYKRSRNLVSDPLGNEGQLVAPAYRGRLRGNYVEDFTSRRNVMTERDIAHLLVHNPLPQLTHLSVPLQKGEGSCIYPIMENVSKTLQVLTLQGEFSLHHSPSIKLPWMRRLAYVHFRGRDSTWVEQYGEGGQGVLKAVKVNLQQLSEREPLDASSFTLVEELAADFGPMYLNPFTARLSARLPLAFPRITKLTLSVHVAKRLREGLDVIFKKMTLLQVLSIGLVEDEDWAPLYYVSSLLLERMPQLIEYWEADRDGAVSRRFWARALPCFVNLTKLRELTLGLDSVSSPFKKSDKECLLSDAVFQFAFFQMPQLQKVRLWGNVKASPEQIKRWQEDDREIEWEERSSHYQRAFGWE